MALVIPPLITTPFADSGDKTVVPATDPAGFVSFLTGYTPDYELNLASGDPQAKAVERGIQNYLFNAGTLTSKAWQTAARPPWYNTMPGGYMKWAEVVYDTGDGNPKPFRSLVAGNVSTPGNSTSWEYIEGTGEMLKHVPMPTGGPGGPSAYLITVATDFNTLTTSGSFQFSSDAVVNGSPNAPANGANKGQAGMLEVTSWADGTNNYVSQFYRDKAGLGFLRGAVNGTWTAWKIWANAQQFTVGEVRMWSGTATQAAVTAAWGPGWRLCDGTNGTPNLRDRFIIGAGSTYPVNTAGGAAAVTLAIAHMPAHNHVINIGDPGHAHGVADSGHAHGVNDPGHAHGVYDPGHAHGNSVAVNQWWLRNENNWAIFWITQQNQTRAATDASGTGIQIYGNGTGISIAGSGSNIGIYAAATGIWANSNNTGSGQAFSIVPPYFALCYVMYTGT